MQHVDDCAFALLETVWQENVLAPASSCNLRMYEALIPLT